MTESNSRAIVPTMQSKKPRVKWNTELFIFKAVKKHSNKYDYSNAIYISAAEKVCITCNKHGDFYQRASHHLNGVGCPGCYKEKLLNFERFKLLANEIHKNKYDYSIITEFRPSKKVKILCKNHGIFSQTPSNHLLGKGCASCNGGVRGNKAEFVYKSNKVHGDRYDYSKVKYINAKTKVLIGCKTHGYFKQPPTIHLAGSGCPKCAGKSLTIDDVKLICNEQHNYKYDYSKLESNEATDIVTIICKVHGEFRQLLMSHKTGTGCPDCAKESRGSYSKARYVNNCKEKYNGKASLYVIKCQKHDEIFYKIGITVQTMKKRYQASKFPYDFETLRLISGESEFIWDIEHRLHSLLLKYKYSPNMNFGGSKTECFSKIPNQVYRLLDSIDKSSQLQLIA